MPRTKPEEKEEEATTTSEKPVATTKGFVVFDSNGKKFRVVEDADEAKALADHIGGRIK